MTGSVSESRFYMWRALFAMSHADAVVTVEERGWMNRVLADEPFTEEQRATLRNDMDVHQDIRTLFSRISEHQDRSQFFDYARTLVWTDGDFGKAEQALMLELKRMHVQSASYDEMEKTDGLRFEEEPRPAPAFLARDTGRAQGGFFTRLLALFSGK